MRPVDENIWAGENIGAGADISCERAAPLWPASLMAVSLKIYHLKNLPINNHGA
jgi:hypothetical protein